MCVNCENVRVMKCSTWNNFKIYPDKTGALLFIRVYSSDMKKVVAFLGNRMIAHGQLSDVAKTVKEVIGQEQETCVLLFDAESSTIVEADLRGSAEDVARRLAEEDTATSAGRPSGPGRPKLGVVPREVTLLPRHWDWLSTQPGGASAALRRLVEEARKRSGPEDELRRAQESAHRFMTAMAGNLPGYEEALRAMYARNRTDFERRTEDWPEDVRKHARALAERTMSEAG